MSITQQFPKNKHTIKKQNETKKLAKIPSYLLTRELTTALRLQEQSFIILIPQKLIQKLGYNRDEINFDLVKYENKIQLIQSDGALN